MNTRKRYRLVYCFLLPYGTVGIVFSFLVLPLSPEITVAAAVIWCVAVFLLFGDSRCPSCGRDLAYGDVNIGYKLFAGQYLMSVKSAAIAGLILKWISLKTRV